MYTLRFRHHQPTRWNGASLENFVYGGTPPNITETVGNVPISTWQHLDSVDGLSEIDFEWAISNESNATSRNINASLTLNGDAYNFVYDWLFGVDYGFLNAVDVEIWDRTCERKFGEFIINPDGVKICGEGCTIDVNIKIIDEITSCFERTPIDSDWQGWFNNNTTKQHPVFDYCAIIEPDWMRWVIYFFSLVATLVLVVILNILNLIFAILNALVVVINAIITVINAIIAVVNTLPGVSITPLDPIDPIEYVDIDQISTDFIELVMGCNRKHPAPYIRTYFENVCQKCTRDLGYNILIDSTNFVNTSFVGNENTYGTGSVFYSTNSPYYNSCLYFPSVKKGLDENSTRYFNEVNFVNWSLKELLDKLASSLNCQWYVKLDNITGNYYLHFESKLSTINTTPLYDFTQEVDYLKLKSKMCWTWNGNKAPAYIEYKYADDATDSTSNTAKERYNDIIEFNKSGNSKYFDGKLNLFNEFACTRVYDDGIEPAPYAERFIPFPFVALASVVQGLILIFAPSSSGFIWNAVENMQLTKILHSSHTVTQPRLIIHDPESSFNHARVKNYHTYNVDTLAGTLPVPTTYNVSGSYADQNPPEESPFTSTGDNNIIKLYNYPFYFDANFQKNLFDYFFRIEDARFLLKKNRSFEIELYFCCDDLDRLGLFDGQNPQLNRTIYYPIAAPFTNTPTNRGVIKKITLESSENGRTIKLEGNI